MNVIKSSALTLNLLALICSFGCQHKKAAPELSNIDLLRGELILCSGKQFGDVSFSFSCSPETRETFDLAISLLHSFEYDEAEKAFVKVIDADPNCAMGYWGIAMSNFHPLWSPPTRENLEKGAKVLKIAASLEKTAKERDYLDAIGAFYKDWETVDHNTRKSNFEQKMRRIYEKYIDDKEAAIFYALALNAIADPADKSYTNQIKAGKILESIFPDQPQHPGIAHYIIHNYDYPELAERALTTARKYAQIAPSSAHAQHMPSHIFTRLGLWQESINSNLNSASAALCYSENVNPGAHWAQELHAVDYLVYAYLQTANTKKAAEQYEYLKTFKKVFPLDFAAAYAMAAIPARIALENRHWADAANLRLPALDFPWAKFPWQESVLYFARGLGAARTGDLKLATTELQHLETLHKELTAAENVYQANQVMIQIKTVQAWIQHADGKNAEAIDLMRAAANLEAHTAKHPVTPGEVLPASELLGDLYLATGQSPEALAVYEENLKQHPNRFNGIYGAAVAAKKSGDMKKAAAYFQQLLKLAGSAGSDRPELAEARAFPVKGL